MMLSADAILDKNPRLTLKSFFTGKEQILADFVNNFPNADLKRTLVDPITITLSSLI